MMIAQNEFIAAHSCDCNKARNKDSSIMPIRHAEMIALAMIVSGSNKFCGNGSHSLNPHEMKKIEIGVNIAMPTSHELSAVEGMLFLLKPKLPK
ncbi:MAG: hypothetical protein AB8C40_08455 [Gammaproteobacteria bacterium]